MEAVIQHWRTILGSAFGASRLAVLFLVLGGFVAMHGIAATTATGMHHNPVVLMSASERHHLTGEPSEVGGMATTGLSGGSETHGPAGSHGLMAGCLLALVGMLAAVVLRWCRAPRRASGGSTSSPSGRIASPPRHPPPRRSLISLCVMRV